MDQAPWYVSLIVSWLPLLLTLAIFVWHARRIARELRTPDGRSVATVIDDLGRELKRSNELLAKLQPEGRVYSEAAPGSAKPPL